MNLQTIEKAVAGSIRNGLGNHSNNHLDGNIKGFSVSDYAEKQQDLQANLLAVSNASVKS